MNSTINLARSIPNPTNYSMASTDQMKIRPALNLDIEPHMQPQTGQLHWIACDACGSKNFQKLYCKSSSKAEVYQLVRCKKCCLVQVGPQPDLAAVAPYYKDTYFEKRSDRGYANYYAPEIKAQINQVYALNLHDLGFDVYESDCLSQTGAQPRCLDAGCAAGYFVEHMQDRNWQSMGVELSPAASKFGRDELGLDILEADFLNCDTLQPGSFDMLSFWASIEHMHSPRLVLARCFELLKPGGRLLLSTCRFGLLARLRGKNWRYMNVPEHLYFFSLPGLIRLAADQGLEKVAHITYGSGLTAKPDAGIMYRVAKYFLDPLVKWTGQGDMMAVHFRKAV